MSNYIASKTVPSLALGTAMWGWTISKHTAFELLNGFYENGFRQIDTATNYPINKNPSDFRKAEMILQEWIQTHGIQDLQVIVKIGSINNQRSPEHNLNKSFILLNFDEYRFKFGSNLEMLMVHWDNRKDEAAIQETLEALDIGRGHGLAIGLSGIRYPALYAVLNEKFQFDFHIQIKHNLLHSDYQNYAAFHGKRCFITYGINAGGIKLEVQEYGANSSLQVRGGNTAQEHPIAARLRQIISAANQEQQRPKLASMNHLGILYAFYSPDIERILIGPSKLEQWQDSLDFYRYLQQFDYTDVFQKLQSPLVSGI